MPGSRVRVPPLLSTQSPQPDGRGLLVSVRGGGHAKFAYVSRLRGRERHPRSRDSRMRIVAATRLRTFVYDEIVAHACFPSSEQIGEHFGVSPAEARRALAELRIGKALL